MAELEKVSLTFQGEILISWWYHNNITSFSTLFYCSCNFYQTGSLFVVWTVKCWLRSVRDSVTLMTKERCGTMLTSGRICVVGGFFLAASFRKVTHFRCESVSSIPMLLSSSICVIEKIKNVITQCMFDLAPWTIRRGKFWFWPISLTHSTSARAVSCDRYHCECTRVI